MGDMEEEDRMVEEMEAGTARPCVAIWGLRVAGCEFVVGGGGDVGNSRCWVLELTRVPCALFPFDCFRRNVSLAFTRRICLQGSGYALNNN